MDKVSEVGVDRINLREIQDSLPNTLVDSARIISLTLANQIQSGNRIGVIKDKSDFKTLSKESRLLLPGVFKNSVTAQSNITYVAPMYYASGIGDNIILEGSTGHDASGNLVTENSVFRIGSLTKHFVSYCISNMRDNGKFDFTDKVSTVLDIGDWNDNISIINLLNHSSGLVSYEEDKVPYSYLQAELLDMVLRESPKFFPGDMFLYSNYGYILLGLIIEKLSKETFEAFIKYNVFVPNSMSASGYIYDKHPNWTNGHTFDKTLRKIVVEPFGNMHETKAFSAAGLFSCGKDLKKWIVKLLDVKPWNLFVDSRQNYELMGMKKVCYTSGFFLENKKLFHFGFFPGYLSGISIFPETSKWALVLAASDNIDVKGMLYDVERSLFQK